MELSTARHEDYLEYASQRMIRFPKSDKFILWVCRTLLAHLRPTHVTVALLDPASHSYLVRASEGHQRIPKGLVNLTTASPLICWFQRAESGAVQYPRSHRLITKQSLAALSSSEADSIAHEMARHRVECCAKIQTYERLAGYLMLGPRDDKTPYDNEDLKFIQILVNNIATEIEKDEYYHSSYFDHLTGLLNRHSMDEKLINILSTSREQGIEFALALGDIDNFKKINDTYGHLVGDMALRTVAEMIRASIRKTDLAFRYGGEEFLILLRMSSRDPGRQVIPADEFHSGIQKVLERVRKKLASRELEALGHSVRVTLSTGLTFFNPRSACLSEDLIHEADQALYEAKQTGKNRICIYRPPPETGSKGSPKKVS